MIGPLENPINYARLQPPNDKIHKYSNLGERIRHAFGSDDPNKGTGAVVMGKFQKMGQAYMKLKDTPPKKTTKAEACFWVAVLCAIVAVALFVSLSIAMGPMGMVMALQLAMIPGIAGGGLFAYGMMERKKEKRLKEWEQPKLKLERDPEISDKEYNERLKKFQAEGARLWNARNTAKRNIEENQQQITELKTKLVRYPSDELRAEIDERNKKKMEYFKDFEEKSVAFWSHANPVKGAELKERFNEARLNRGELGLFKASDGEMPRLEPQDPNLTEEQLKQFRLEGEKLWSARNDAKSNIEEVQRQIEKKEEELEKAEHKKKPTKNIQAEIDLRNKYKNKFIKDFQEKSVAFWTHANPEKGALLKEHFSKDLKGQDLFAIENLVRSEEKEDLPAR